MQIQKRSMNWLPKASLYDEQSAQRQKQKSAHQDFISSQSSFMSSVSDIMSNNTSEEGNLVAQVASARLGVDIST